MTDREIDLASVLNTQKLKAHEVAIELLNKAQTCPAVRCETDGWEIMVSFERNRPWPWRVSARVLKDGALPSVPNEIVRAMAGAVAVRYGITRDGQALTFMWCP